MNPKNRLVTYARLLFAGLLIVAGIEILHFVVSNSVQSEHWPSLFMIGPASIGLGLGSLLGARLLFPVLFGAIGFGVGWLWLPMAMVIGLGQL